MNYSIIPEDMLLNEERIDNTTEVEIDGIMMEVKLNDDNSGEVIRVISSNPLDYLNYQPGAKIELEASLK